MISSLNNYDFIHGEVIKPQVTFISFNDIDNPWSL
jgi:hypothetical protein